MKVQAINGSYEVSSEIYCRRSPDVQIGPISIKIIYRVIWHHVIIFMCLVTATCDSYSREHGNYSLSELQMRLVNTMEHGMIKVNICLNNLEVILRVTVAV